MKQIAILGSTGSIGCNTLRVVDALKGGFGVAALGAGSNVELLTRQVEQYRPRVVSAGDEECAEKLRYELKRRGVKQPRVGVGVEGLCEVATCDGVEIVIGAVVGARGLLPVYRALELGRRVALANKDTLVVAGELMTRAAEKSGAELLPVDSEHNALHQCLRGEKRSEVRRIILTASGGPFRTRDKAAIQSATVAEAMQHPTWNMGAKITIDSATLMNKGLEVIEAHWLFGFGADQIGIVVHPESVVHSMIELVDGSVIAQMGITDMRHAIQYALTNPERHVCELPPLDLTSVSALHFESPDLERFPCIPLAYRALREGGTLPAAMNAANEEAVRAFIEERISLTDIALVIEAVMDHHQTQPAADLETIIDTDRTSRLSAAAEIEKLTKSSSLLAKS